MNKQDLIKKIKDLTDISNDEKAYLIELVNTKKKYGLVWEDKPEDVEEQLRSMLPVFKEVKERAIISDDENAPNHILIEGDNLHALTALSYTHEGKVDVIYIDPPYNTGNKDFIYNDAYVDKEDTYRHSKWLSFMDKRLRLAKKLLSDNGVIFISIDDNEQAQLKLLCDEILNENNFIGNFIWTKKKKGSHLSKTIRSMTEYVLVYSKDISNTELFGEAAYSNKWQPLVKRTNSLKTLTFPKNFITTTLTDQIIEKGIYGNGSSSIEILNDIIVENQLIKSELNVNAPFVWTQKKLDEEITNGSQISLSSKFGFNTLRHDQDSKIKRPSTIINSEVGVGTNEDAYQELINIFNEEGVMTYPKPTSLIEYLLNTKTYFNKDAIILDFFAGTGTTLHATMALNEKDNGNRTCIIVTNNENQIAEKVAYERNKRVIQGYTNAKGEQVEGLINNNLRYYQADFVPSERTEVNRRLLTARSTELLCIKENCFIDKTNDFGINEKQAKLFSNGLGKYMVVVYHTRNQEEVIEQLSSIISGLETSEKVKVYAFSPEKEIIEDDFYKVADKITAVPLPDSIYNAYRATFRTLKLDKKGAVSSTTNQEA
ncbi:site-specific DNA-methyltransferase [Empedobacter sp. R132-2]|uniref:site-specific DNA-methyltransferase n=1 Tax=Empedobacter sp. R132-2 TaxID=2746740 RepID=UPI002576B6E1|nr:site-specific DNA-methyltransferase [Empedobacter sp. R132-2]MDM1137818.1 site-specific DNA-methyltransferase [Empedobacter sp. R132-2]